MDLCVKGKKPVSVKMCLKQRYIVNMTTVESSWLIPMKAIGAQNLLTMPGGVTMSGYLHKKGGSQFYLMKWPLRFIIIHEGCVYYFKSSTSATPQGAFSLNGYNRVMRATEETTCNNVFPFKVVHFSKHQRTWYFSAASEDERRKWMRQLRREIDFYNEKKDIHITSDVDTDAEGFYGSIERPLNIIHTTEYPDEVYVDEDDSEEEPYETPDESPSSSGHPPVPPPSYPPPPVPAPSPHVTKVNTQSPKFPLIPLPPNKPPPSLFPKTSPPPIQNHNVLPKTILPRSSGGSRGPPPIPIKPDNVKWSTVPSCLNRDNRTGPLTHSSNTLHVCSDLGKVMRSMNFKPAALGNAAAPAPPNLSTKPKPVTSLQPLPPRPKPKPSSSPLQYSPDGQSFRSSLEEVPAPLRMKGMPQEVDLDSDEDYEHVPLPDSVFIDTTETSNVERLFKENYTIPEDGVYCIRNSGTKTTKVLVVWDISVDKARNYRIFEENSKFFLEMDVTFPSLESLVEHYYSHPLPKHGSLRLQRPYGYDPPR
ncbi:SH3 domain-binding protein 2 isoform X2 [Denticeps clupeoides]|uniref:SH3 domain-binding protein 2 isoform X2 n=1 Tax=Denticeps clupeoides TaxID=299321 RepID=UPI0010A38797|nr:SH3 domain-binding protein 2 isoform X2 [Denticeps clupeoides]